MKHFYLLLFFSFISFEIHSMERLASLRALPVAEDTSSQEAIIRPNPADSTSDDLFLRLWQNPRCKAHLELPLLETKIKHLEKKHEKVKKAFNEKQDKVIDQGMYGAGFLALSLFMDYTKRDVPLGGAFFFGGYSTPLQNLNYGLKAIIRPMLETDFRFVDWGRVIFFGAAFLAVKNIAQAGINYRSLPSKPQEPQELIDAREQKAQLLLTLQQSA